MFSQDFKELLSAFNEHRVKYLIVGGYAVAVHAQPRATKDLDIFIEPSPDNAKAVFAALAEFGAPLTDLRRRDFTDPNIFFRMGTPLQMIGDTPESALTRIPFSNTQLLQRNVPVLLPRHRLHLRLQHPQ